jgi:tripartite-type tricarboxylate transporter receptor subunit TctC
LNAGPARGEGTSPCCESHGESFPPALSASAPWPALLGRRAQKLTRSKVIKLVVPAGPGGPTDLLARLIAERMAAALGQAVIVDSRGGAGIQMD